MGSQKEMSSPQLENGFIRISTELWDAICKLRIPGECRQVFDFIIRKTYGWNKKEDAISLSQFVSGTGIIKTHIQRSIKKLEDMNLIVTKKGNDHGNFYRINKKYQTWKPLPKKVTLPNKVIGVTKEGNKSLPIMGHTIDNYTKDTITKDKGSYPIRLNPPKLEEVITYGSLIGIKKDLCVQFFNDYESKGWRINGADMYNWEPKLRNWKANEHKFKPKNNQYDDETKEEREARYKRLAEEVANESNN